MLWREKLHGNLKKCSFITNRLVFLGYVVTSDRIMVDDEKVKAVRDWPTPSNVHDVIWTKEPDESFRLIKKLTEAPILAL